jgi:hypothetical protein
MKKMLFAAVVAMSTLLVLSGCGGSHSSPPPSTVTQITSDVEVDGDIELAPPNFFTITQATLDNTQSVQLGRDPLTGFETRAFLDFPLTGSGGVPGSARIDSATLNVFLNPPIGFSTVTFRIELIRLVSTAPIQQLDPLDFDQAPLASTTSTRPVAANGQVSLDVTDLMDEAQFRQLANFQVRISKDSVGIVEIDDPITPVARAPFLEVIYH